LACGLALGLTAGGGCQRKADPAAQAPPPAVVTVAKPLQREVQDSEDFSGRTEAVQAVEIRARVTGYLDQVLFKDGNEVQQSQPLYEIDPRPFQADYDRATAQLAVQEANLKYRQAELARNRELLPTRAVSQTEFDQSVAAEAQARAEVKSSLATQERDRLNLAFTKIAAPIAGEISRTNITAGNLVTADQTQLTSIVSVDPIYVYFDADEPTMLRIQEDIRSGKIKKEGTHAMTVLMGLDTEQGFPHEGKINFADNRVDPNTGTIRLRGVFANPKPAVGDRVLMPGLFARVRIPTGPRHKALTVPEQALAMQMGERYVLVVDAKNQVESRGVKVGSLEGGLRVVAAGLGPDDRVIVNGMQRVRPGVTVEPKEVEMSSLLTPGGGENKPAACGNQVTDVP
jgi:RND family efflux transporter MFP subunit